MAESASPRLSRHPEGGAVLVGDIGDTKAAAEYAAAMQKPVVAFIAGRASPPGKKMGPMPAPS